MAAKLRIRSLLWLGLVSPFLAPQCVENLSERCDLTLTCPETEASTGGASGSQTSTATGSRDAGKDPGKDAGAFAAEGNCEVAGCDSPLTCAPETKRCVECLEDAHCGSKPDASSSQAEADRFACDTGTNTCVECTSDVHCEGASPRCDESLNRCVECLSTDDCSGDTPACNTSAGVCTATCSDQDECPADSLCQTSAQLCVECLSTDDCTEGTQCNLQSNQCVACVDDSACGGLAPRCDSSTNLCVSCVENDDCSGTEAVCLSSSKSCVQCASSDQCSDPFNARCNQATNTCDTCTQNEQCPAGAPLCRADGTCVACVGDDNCAAPSVCALASGACVQCTDSAQCTSPSSSRCDTGSGTCQGCLLPEDCSGVNGGGVLCRTTDNLCVGCLSNTDCGDATASRCDDALGACAGCSSPADCAHLTGRTSCKTPGTGGVCVECVTSDDCGGATPICDTGNNTCVECVENSECGDASLSRCEDRQCVACRDGNADDCAGIDDDGTELGVCDTSGGTGQCVQCTGTQFQACEGNVCDSLEKVCSSEALRTATLCAECLAGNHCAGGLECIADRFQGANTGTFRCFPEDDNSCPLPFNTGAPRTNIDGQPVVICPLDGTTTCAAYESTTDPCTDDVECGQNGLNDGRCVPARNFCSLPCENSFDCEAGVDCAPNGICTP